MHIDRYIQNIDDVICENIDDISPSCRGKLSQNILSQLRNFVEHVFIKLRNPNADLISDYDPIKEGIAHIKSMGRYKWLYIFHECLQESVSHYTPDKEDSERLMLKYYEYNRRKHNAMNRLTQSQCRGKRSRSSLLLMSGYFELSVNLLYKILGLKYSPLFLRY